MGVQRIMDLEFLPQPNNHISLALQYKSANLYEYGRSASTVLALSLVSSAVIKLSDAAHTHTYSPPRPGPQPGQFF